ncbi:hypothetical protein T439DRAFT_12190 [Meredithblackwellia eburnea MCA 4105]
MPNNYHTSANYDPRHPPPNVFAVNGPPTKPSVHSSVYPQPTLGIKTSESKHSAPFDPTPDPWDVRRSKNVKKKVPSPKKRVLQSDVRPSLSFKERLSQPSSGRHYSIHSSQSKFPHQISRAGSHTSSGDADAKTKSVPKNSSHSSFSTKMSLKPSHSSTASQPTSSIGGQHLKTVQQLSRHSSQGSLHRSSSQSSNPSSKNTLVKSSTSSSKDYNSIAKAAAPKLTKKDPNRQSSTSSTNALKRKTSELIIISDSEDDDTPRRKQRKLHNY